MADLKARRFALLAWIVIRSPLARRLPADRMPMPNKDQKKIESVELCQINERICKGCELCVKFCPRHALEMSSDRNAAGFHPAFLAHPDLCTGCALCAEMCPEAGITVYRRRKARASEAKVGQG